MNSGITTRLAAALVLVSLLVASCTPRGELPDSTPTTAAAGSTGSPHPPTDPGPVPGSSTPTAGSDSNLADSPATDFAAGIHSTIVEAAIVDLAIRLEVDPGSIAILLIEEVTWPDGGLGCPEPGMMYTQALVEGLRIVLTADGAEYSYHAALDGDPFLCEQASSENLRVPEGSVVYEKGTIPPPGSGDE